MNVFNMGILEIMVILVVGLILFGPDKLFELIRTLRKAFNEFQRTASDLTSAAFDQSEAAARQQKASEQNDRKEFVSEQEVPREKPGTEESTSRGQDAQQ